MPKEESSKILIPEAPKVQIQAVKKPTPKPDQRKLIQSIIQKSLTAQKKTEKTFSEA